VDARASGGDRKEKNDETPPAVPDRNARDLADAWPRQPPVAPARPAWPCTRTPPGPSWLRTLAQGGGGRWPSLGERERERGVRERRGLVVLFSRSEEITRAGCGGGGRGGRADRSIDGRVSARARGVWGSVCEDARATSGRSSPLPPPAQRARARRLACRPQSRQHAPALPSSARESLVPSRPTRPGTTGRAHSRRPDPPVRPVSSLAACPCAEIGRPNESVSPESRRGRKKKSVSGARSSRARRMPSQRAARRAAWLGPGRAHSPETS
jgi:hypothetical protein